MCGSCDSNYVNRSGLDCFECPDYQSNLLLSFIKFVWTIILILTLAWINESYAMTTQKYFLAFQTSLKVMINHCVILSAINGIRYSWQPGIAGIISVENRVTELLANLVQFKCLLRHSADLQQLDIL